MAPRAKAPGVESLDPYDTDARLATARERLTSGKAPISKEAAGAILEFVNSRSAEVSRARALLYLRQLTRDAEKLGSGFLSPTEETPARLRAAYKGYEGWTLKTSATVLAKFWKHRFERAGTEFPDYLSIRVGAKQLARKDETDVITPEEVERLIAAATNDRDRAFIATLYESGCRVGELLGLRIRDCERTRGEAGIRLHVDGKTGRRTVPLFEAAVPALSTWLRCHPKASDLDAPVWVGTQTTEGRYGQPLSYPAVRSILHNVALRTGIKKRIHAHGFRHSRASAVAKNGRVSTSILESYFGWRHGSPMAQTYVHLNGREVEDAMASALGVRAEEPAPSPRLARECGRCRTPNPAGSNYCSMCSAPLTAEAEGRLIEDDATMRELAALLKRPTVARFLAKELGRITHMP